MLFPVIVKKLKTMEVSILIRQERPEDYDTVYHVVKPNASKAKDVIEITLKWIKNILQIN